MRSPWSRALGLIVLAPLVAAAGTGTSQLDCPDWAMYGRTLGRTFAIDSTACSPITPSSVATLVPKWFFKTPKTVTASPVVAGGVVYVGDWSPAMYALDADDGSVVWTTPLPSSPGATFGPVVSSAALADVDPGAGTRRLLFFGAGPCLYALDASTGTAGTAAPECGFGATPGSAGWVRYFGALCNGQTLAPGTSCDEPTEIESSPAIRNGVLYVGIDTHNLGLDEAGDVSGGLLAVDAATGALLWKFEPELGAREGCGGMWSSPTVDETRNRVYLATANCERDPDEWTWTPHVEAVTAVDATTGAPVWAFQPHTPNRLDHDFGATPNLFDVGPCTEGTCRDGRACTVESDCDILGAGNKDATYYALDPDDLVPGATPRPELLWARQVAVPGDVPGFLQEDFAIGGFIGSPATWRGNVYGTTAIGGPFYYHALDGTTGNSLWPIPGIGGPSYAASAVVNGVVFAGALDDVFKAYDAETGVLLWALPLSGPISSGPAIAGDSVYVGAGTSSSDACVKGQDPFTSACLALFEEVLGATGGVHAFRLAPAP